MSTTNTYSYKYLDLITGLFATLLIVSNLASTRMIAVGDWLNFDAGTLMFPFTYIFNDLLTEVYGYSRSRRVIWIGFLALIISALSMYFVGIFPPSEGWELADAWDKIMRLVPRIVAASLLAYFIGEFVNSYVLAKLKVKTGGRHLWFRLIASTAAGQLLDTLLFVSIAFLGVVGLTLWLKILISNYIFKLLIEVILLPLTIFIVSKVKETEGVDSFDEKTKFSPFRWKD